MSLLDRILFWRRPKIIYYEVPDYKYHTYTKERFREIKAKKKRVKAARRTTRAKYKR